MTSHDSLQPFKDERMGGFQVVAAAFCAVAVITDGYDTVSFSLAAPFILKSLHLSPGALGLVFSALALGMVVGAFAGTVADRIGRRTVVLAASGSAAVLMLLTGLTDEIVVFAILRFLTGIAVGAMVTTLNVLALEHANRKSGGFYLGLVHVGIGIGATLGAAVATLVIVGHGWRWIFFFGAGFNAVITVVGWFVLPESIPFLAGSGRANALARMNRVLVRFGHAAVDTLPAAISTTAAAESRRERLRAFVQPALLLATTLLAIGSFAHFLVAYFHNSWAPKLLIDAGLDPETALSGGIAAGLASLTGNLMVGLLCARYDPRKVTAAAFCTGAVALVGFGLAHGHAAVLIGSAALVSMFGSATNTGVYLSAARRFPARMRNTGVGIVAGIGRIGAVLGPALGGALVGLGWGRASYYPVFAALYLLGGLALFLASRPTQGDDYDSDQATTMAS